MLKFHLINTFRNSKKQRKFKISHEGISKSVDDIKKRY